MISIARVLHLHGWTEWHGFLWDIYIDNCIITIIISMDVIERIPMRYSRATWFSDLHVSSEAEGTAALLHSCLGD